jgi:hypothetical protein
MRADVNDDGIVDIKDISIVCRNFGMTFGRHGYDPNTNINNDEIVDVIEVSFVCRKLRKRSP